MRHDIKPATRKDRPVTALPHRDVFAAFTRKAIEDHGEWASPHCFMTLHAEDGQLHCRTYAAIMPDISPPDYPSLMFRLAGEELEKHRDDPACAYLLQIEAFGVTGPGKGATEAEREQYARDRLGRTFHERPDAVESAVAWCADVHGRLWSAAKIRGREDKGISESFYQPGRAAIGGRMVKGLLSVAYATGMKAWGLPGPQWPLN
jgi:hypothetical protein